MKTTNLGNNEIISSNVIKKVIIQELLPSKAKPVRFSVNDYIIGFSRHALKRAIERRIDLTFVAQHLGSLLVLKKDYNKIKKFKFDNSLIVARFNKTGWSIITVMKE